MIRKALFVVSLGIFGTVYSQNINKQKLDAYFKALDENHKVMGSFAIAKDDKIVYTNAIGFSDVEASKKADENTVYRIGSISKTFTAVLIMKAVEENKLKLSDKLSKYFPEIKNADKITVENLLQHRSGVHSFTDEDDYLTYHTQKKSQAELLAKIEKFDSDFEPGGKFEYSNSNFTLLGLMLEKIYKESYASVLQEKISKPLGLKKTLVGEKINASKNAAASYEFDSKKYVKSSETDMSIPIGAGNLVSTPSELLRFLMALENGKLISKESLSQMKNFQDHYGLGLMEVPFNKKKGYGHNGSIDNFNSVLYYFPDGKASFAMITNQSNFDNNQISINAMKAAYGMDFEIPNFKTVAVAEADLKKLEGTYSNINFPLKLTIFVKNGKLFGQGTGQSEFPLEAESKTKFNFDMAGIEMEFVPEKKQMNFSQMGNKMVFTKEN